MARRVGLRFTVLAAVAWILLLRPPVLGGDATYVIVAGTSMQPALHTGDLAIVRRGHSYRPGDVIAYRAGGATIIHRIVGGGPADGFVTRGDNRRYVDLWRPRPDDIAGSVWLELPKAGFLLNAAQRPAGLAVLGALFALALTLRPPPRRRSAEPLLE